MRDHTVSISKALAIMLMVLAHTRFSSFGNEVINLFHMPLFFFFSGYCFKEKYLENFRKYSVKRLRGIWFPYVKWGGMFLLLHNLFYLLNFYGPNIYGTSDFSQIYTIKEIGMNMLCIFIRLTNHDQLLGGYWFLHTLFFASFISYAFLRFVKNHMCALCLSLGVTVLVYYFSLNLPFFKVGGREMLASTFIIAGKLCNRTEYKMIISKYRRALMILAFILLGVGTQFLCCSMLSMTWDKVILYFITAVTCSMLIHVIAIYVNKVNETNIKAVLCYIGDNTMSILTWHFVVFKFVSLFIIFVYGLPLGMISSFPVIEEYSSKGWWTVYFCVGCILPLVGKRISESLRYKL